MTSTEPRLADRRLAPQPGLLDDLIDQALRARQRRLYTADHPGLNLAALRVSDTAIDQAILAIKAYGRPATELLDQRIAESNGRALEAAIFLRIALAIQAREPQTVDLAVQYLPQHERAVYEAQRSFPVPNGPFEDDDTHVLAFFEHAQHQPTWLPLALQLAGERDVKALRHAIEPLTERAELAAPAHFALACMGMAHPACADFVHAALMSGDAQKIDAAVKICAVDPRIAVGRDLAEALRARSHAIDAAWGILACQYPRQTFDYAMADATLEPAIKIRLAAFTGFADGAIRLCAELAERDGCLTPAEADVLELVFGAIPAEARCEPNDRAAKSRALRELVLHACRKAHIPLCNDADRCAWQLDQILAEPAQAVTVRLRSGQRINETKPPEMGRALFNVTHGLRQWLYYERAIAGGHALALSAYDVSRRQELAMMIAEVADEMRDS